MTNQKGVIDVAMGIGIAVLVVLTMIQNNWVGQKQSPGASNDMQHDSEMYKEEPTQQ